MNDSRFSRQATLALGRLKAGNRDPGVVARVERLLREDQDPEVLDAAYDALLSLVSAPEPD